MIGFYLALAWAHLISLLPFAWLYRLSDGLAWLLDRLIGYRRAVIECNLQRAFPHYSAEKRSQIRRDFYRNFSDILLESFKSLRLREKSMRRRLRLRNPEVFGQLQAQGRGCIVVMGHHTNFEWTAMGLPLLLPQPCFAVYHPLKNPRFNRQIVAIRERFGLKLFRMKETYPFMLNNPAPTPAYIFMADQSPHKGKVRYRAPFFDQPTPVHLGVENLAKKCDLAVVFIKLYRVRRGHYEIEAELLFDQTQALPPYLVTNRHVATLEAMIRRDPAQWLWSHKRWKHA